MKTVRCERVEAALREVCRRFGWADYLFTFSRNRYLFGWNNGGFVCEASPGALAFFSEHYRLRLHTEDPRHVTIQNSDVPQVFVYERLPRNGTPREQRFYELIERAGWNSSISMPVHGYGGAMGITTLHHRDADVPRDVIAATIAHISPLLFQFNAWSREMLARGEIEELLTQREIECLHLVSKGKSSREIAAMLDITKRTVDFHVTNATQKLGGASRSEAAAILSQLLVTRGPGAKSLAGPGRRREG